MTDPAVIRVSVNTGPGTLTVRGNTAPTLVHVNTPGPQGPKGDQGAEGAPGADGQDGTNGTNGVDGTGALYISVADYGAVGDGVTDDTFAIQAAIDAAYVAGKSVIWIPAGDYRTTLPIFLDAPNSLRGSASAWSAGTSYSVGNTVKYLGMQWISLGNANLANTPALGSVWWELNYASASTFSFGLTLMGDNGTGNADGYGTNIVCDFYLAPALIIGPGQGQIVRNLNLRGYARNGLPVQKNYRGCQDSRSCGIAIACSNAGVTRTLIEQCEVQNFYGGIWNNYLGNGGLGDSTTINKCEIRDCYTGINIDGGQAFINGVYETVVSGCTRCIVSRSGATVVGGNISPQYSLGTKLSIGSISSLTDDGNGNFTFTGTLSAPVYNAGTNYQYNGTDNIALYNGTIWFSFVNAPPGETPTFSSGAWIPLENMTPPYDVFNAWTLETEHFGAIPLRITDYDSGTLVATFVFSDAWSSNYNTNVNTTSWLAKSRIEADVQNCTEIYAAELPVVFTGQGINAFGSFVEESLPGPITVLDTTFGHNATATLQAVQFNSDPGLIQYRPRSSPNDWQAAEYITAKVHPFIRCTSVKRVNLINNFFECLDQVSVISAGADVLGDHASLVGNLLEFDSAPSVWPTWIRNIPSQEGVGGAYRLMTDDYAQSPFSGQQPQFSAVPLVRAADFAAFFAATSIPTITHTGGTYWDDNLTYRWSTGDDYPLMWGGRTYQLVAAGTPATMVNDTSQIQVFIANGLAAPGALGGPGGLKNDVLLAATNLTDNTDDLASFDTFLNNSGNIVQTSAVDLSSKTFQFIFKTPKFVMSTHNWFTWGQDLTTTNVPNLSWSYKGGSNCVYANPELLFLMIPGLGVILNGVLYRVHTVQYELGYFTVFSPSNFQLQGDIDTIYTGTTVGQQAYNMVVL